MQDDQKLFLRFLKENNLYYMWYDFTNINNDSDALSWLKKNNSVSFLMSAFGWGDCNSYYHNRILWSYFHNDWLILLEEYNGEK